ncbi:MAG TPA: hypothetical protein VK716_14055 [Terracidiphilus sp.]|jgi:hypothetical protein|nr:hypothetical protein [Terracidiphilus sp.]
MDAIEILLDRQMDNEMASRVLRFHRANRHFIPRLVAELFWLKEQGRKAAGVKSITNFLRWEMRLTATPEEEYAINDQFNATFARIVLLLWPSLDGMIRIRTVRDEVPARVGRRRYGHALRPNLETVSGAEFTYGHGREGATIALDGLKHLSPAVPVIGKPPSFHERMSKKEASAAVRPLARLIGKAPDSNHPLLGEWVHHLANQPECFHFMAQTLLDRNPKEFSANSLYEYARWTLYRVAETGRTFNLDDRLRDMYGRGLLYALPQFNGRCEARDTLVDRVLGCTIAPELVNGEPFRRVIFRS